MTRTLARAAFAGLVLATVVAPATAASADEYVTIVEFCEPPEDPPNGVKIYPPFGIAQPIKICFLGP